MTTPASSTIVRRLLKTCNVLRDERRLESRLAVPCEDEFESVVEVGWKRAGRLRQAVPCGDDMLRSAFEGRLVKIVGRVATRPHNGVPTITRRIPAKTHRISE